MVVGQCHLWRRHPSEKSHTVPMTCQELQLSRSSERDQKYYNRSLLFKRSHMRP